MPRFAYLGAHFSDRRNPMASRLSYALSAEEDAVLDQLIEAVEGTPDATVSALMFDGVIVEAVGHERQIIVEGMLAAGEALGIKMAEKPWPAPDYSE